jgi:hypothetical protein
VSESGASSGPRIPEATFTVARGRRAHAGRYRVTMTVDAGGRVAAGTRSVRIG